MLNGTARLPAGVFQAHAADHLKEGDRPLSPCTVTDFDIETYCAELRGEIGKGQDDNAQGAQGQFFTSRFDLVADQLALVASNREAAMAGRDAIGKQRGLIAGKREEAIETKTEKCKIENNAE